jgi:ribosome-binding protein aMBF1 (putative translation factor)
MSMAKQAKTQGTLVAEEMNRDPQFREEWEATAVARLVAAKIINYRAENKLSQRALAEKLGVKQPFVARLEAGETNPEVETLIKLSRVLRIEFVIDISPEKRAPKLVTKRARDQQVAQVRDGVSVVFAAT